MNNPMCNDLDNARLNRERIKRGVTNQYYDEQANILAQWLWCEPPPADLVIGELPVIDLKQIQLDR